MKIQFKELSIPLKIAIVFGWIAGSIYALAFISGFLEGIFSTV